MSAPVFVHIDTSSFQYFRDKFLKRNFKFLNEVIFKTKCAINDHQQVIQEVHSLRGLRKRLILM